MQNITNHEKACSFGQVQNCDIAQMLPVWTRLVESGTVYEHFPNALRAVGAESLKEMFFAEPADLDTLRSNSKVSSSAFTFKANTCWADNEPMTSQKMYHIFRSSAKDQFWSKVSLNKLFTRMKSYPIPTNYNTKDGAEILIKGSFFSFPDWMRNDDPQDEITVEATPQYSFTDLAVGGLGVGSIFVPVGGERTFILWKHAIDLSPEEVYELLVDIVGAMDKSHHSPNGELFEKYGSKMKTITVASIKGNTALFVPPGMSYAIWTLKPGYTVKANESWFKSMKYQGKCVSNLLLALSGQDTIKPNGREWVNGVLIQYFQAFLNAMTTSNHTSDKLIYFAADGFESFVMKNIMISNLETLREMHKEQLIMIKALINDWRAQKFKEKEAELKFQLQNNTIPVMDMSG